jgi:hypothetical protein
MSIAIPLVMHDYFFALTKPGTEPEHLHALHKVLQFLSVAAKGGFRERCAELVTRVDQTKILYNELDNLLIEFFEQVVYFQADPRNQDQPSGYKLRVIETLRTTDNSECFELEGIKINLATDKQIQNGVVEWFDRRYPRDLLFAIETRLNTPETMYSGLGFDSNLEQDL